MCRPQAQIYPSEYLLVFPCTSDKHSTWDKVSDRLSTRHHRTTLTSDVVDNHRDCWLISPHVRLSVCRILCLRFLEAVMAPTPVLLFILVLFPLLYRYLLTRRRSCSRLPPGPRPYAIVGNLLDVPKDQPWITYREWSKKYGPSSFFTSFGIDLLILEALT